MGEMVMKTLLDRNAFVLAGLEGKQKRQALAVMLALSAFFVLSALTFMNFLYCFSDCVGSVVCGSADIALRDALRSLPIILSFFLSLSGLLTANAFYRNESFEILRRKARKHALIAAVTGAAVPVYVIVMRLAGRYLSLTEGGPSRLYPLDAMLYALLFLAFGITVLTYLKKAERFAGPSRAPVRKKGRVIGCFFRAVWLLIGLYGFCGFFFSIFILDFSVGYVPYSLSVMLVSLLAFLSLAVWKLFYENLTEAKRKEAALPLALLPLALSLAAAAAYFLALKHNLEGPANVGLGILPVACSAGVNIATLLVVATPPIVSVSALVRWLRGRAGKG